ncbi:MAG: hypothetical protein NTW52_05375 [Planctomycetota bacterium]|nr:hypothetical protein [Planctomycetota bacterium]
MTLLSHEFLFAQVAIPEIVFGNARWINAVLVVGVVFGLLTIFTYARSSKIRRVPIGLRFVAFTSRIFGVALLLACLLDPMGTSQRPKPQANLFAVVVDDSQSMDVLIHNKSLGISKKEKPITMQFLAADADWSRKLAEDFRVRKYRFSNNLESTDSLQEIANNGTGSEVYLSLESIRDRYNGQPLAGVLLITDGMATDSRPKDWIRKLGYPIYPVRITGENFSSKSISDIRIGSITTRQSDFEAAPVTIQGSITHDGFVGESVTVDLVDSDGKVQESKTLKLGNNNELTPVEFRFRPEKSGVLGYRMVVRRTVAQQQDSTTVNDERKSESKPVGDSEEATLGNNERFQVVDRGRGPYKILYFAGRPNWEFKFLKRALDEDDEIKLTSLIRIANKQPKFNFRESKVDSSNPLFSGFEDISDEEKQKYDEPVFVRMGVTEAGQLKLGFPKQAEELFEYSAIILDDLEPEFLSQADQSLIRQFVTVRGGSLLVLGGTESMRGKGFQNSIISQMLPFYCEDNYRSQAMNDSGPATIDATSNSESKAYRFQLTREGWLQPFLRLAENENAEQDRLRAMPSFEVMNSLTKIKPGASVLAEAMISQAGVRAANSQDSNTNSDATLPVLITQRFGKGRSSAFTIGDMWRWGLHRPGGPTPAEEPKNSPLAQSWRQMVRWLIADVPHAVELRLVQEADQNQSSNRKSFRLQVDTKDVDFNVVENANVQVTVVSPSGKTVVARAEPSRQAVGTYEATFVGDAQGVYSATAEVTSSNGRELGSAQLGWSYEPLAIEYQSLGENTGFLELLASESGGEVIESNDLDRFVANLPTRRAPIVETRIYQLWHQSWVMILALGCLSIEWGIRRRYGMA